jgi:crotonobetainyl-CoA hydratase
MSAADGGDDEVVLSATVDHVLVVTINRPDARNAVNLDVARGLGAALHRADLDPDVRAVVVTGAGEQAFCAGADLKALARDEPVEAGPQPDDNSWGFAGYVRHHIGKPTIAAVNGVALGGGTEIVIASDLAVAADTAIFGLPEVRWGLIAGGGGAFRLPRLVPRKFAMELLLTGEAIDAREALRIGLVNRVVDAERVLEVALTMAARIAANAPLAVRASKTVASAVEGGVATEETHLWRMSDQADQIMRTSQDAAEGTAAFAERRQPTWQGK